MKRCKNNRFGYYFLKHLGIMAIVWCLLMYVFLQSAFFIVRSKMEQKTAINFYEGMENIQYLMKDAALEDEMADMTLLLNGMSRAGEYHYYPYKITGYPGYLIGLRLGWLKIFMELGPGIFKDGEDNIFVGGFGKGYGFILDQETGEIVCESGLNDKMAILYVKNRDDDNKVSPNSIVYTSSVYEKYWCDKEDLMALSKEMDLALEKWMAYYKEEDPNYDDMTFGWTLEDFYVKNEKFFPARISLYYYDRKGGGPNRLPKAFCEELEFQPENREGYSLYHLDSERQWASLTFLNGMDDMDGIVNWKPDEAFRSKAVEEFKTKRKGNYHLQDMGEGWLVGNPLFYFYNGEMVFIRSAYFSDVTGRSYLVCVYQNVSELFPGNASFVVAWGIWFAFALLWIALLTAYLSFLKNRHILMTKEYREVLMDSMAHDLKSPLMAISGYAENLRAHMNDEKRDHYAEEIQKSVTYMNDIVMKNLEILKYDKEKRRLIQKNTDLRKLFEEAFARYQGEVEKRDLHVTVEGELSKKGDEELLQKVAENLVTNAIRYTPDGGTINVAFDKKKNRFSVQNDTEIEYKGKLNHLWEPFVRGEDSRTGRGTGLGLAIVSNVLDRHAWKYMLRYDKETKKFTCIVKIPMGIF